MKNIVLFLFMLPCILFSQVQDPCSNSIIDYLTDHENSNKPISYQLSQGWNMVGYYGTAQNNEMSTQINEESLSDASTIEETFQVIKNVSGQFWSPQFSQLNTLTPGEGYMMYVITDNPPAISFNAQFQMPQISGCTNCLAENFRPIATVDDGSCLILGCTSELAVNFDIEATVDDGLCEFDDQGCTNSLANNYNSYVEIDDGSCIYGNFNLNADIFEDNYFGHASTGNAVLTNVPSEFIGSSYIVHFEGQNISPVKTIEGDAMSIIIWGYDYLNGPDSPGAQPGQQVNIALLHPSGYIVDVIVSPPIIYEINLLFEFDEVVYSISGQEVVFGCTDSEATNYNELATIDNGSCDFSLSIAVGDLAEGGIVFYVDETGEHGLVAAMEDIEGTYEWGCYETDLAGADGQAIGTGYQNTMDIVNQGCVTENGGITAAKAAYDAEINGYSDWYLPSFYEQDEMYNTIGNGGPEGYIGGFENSLYWSSSENGNNYAFFFDFSGGAGIYNPKGYAYRVRVIRAF